MRLLFAALLFLTCACGNTNKGKDSTTKPKKKAEKPAELTQPVANRGEFFSLASFEGLQRKYLYCGLTRQSFDPATERCRAMSDVEKKLSGNYKLANPPTGTTGWTLLGNVAVIQGKKVDVLLMDLTEKDNFGSNNANGRLQLFYPDESGIPTIDFDFYFYRRANTKLLTLESATIKRELVESALSAMEAKFLPRFDPSRYAEGEAKSRVECAVLDQGYNRESGKCHSMTETESKMSALYLSPKDSPKSLGSWLVGNSLISLDEPYQVTTMDLDIAQDEERSDGVLVTGKATYRELGGKEDGETRSFLFYNKGGLRQFDTSGYKMLIGLDRDAVKRLYGSHL